MANIEDIWETLSLDERQLCEGAMNKYNGNTWWKAVDLVKLAVYQVFEDVLLADFSNYREGLKMILGREVAPVELHLDNVRYLRREVQKATRERYLEAVNN